MIYSKLAIFLIIVGWILLYIVVYRVGFRVIEFFRKEEKKIWGAEIEDYDLEKWKFKFDVTVFFIGVPAFVLYVVLQKLFAEKGIVPFSNIFWIVGSIIVGVIWVTLFVMIYLKGIQRIESLRKAHKKKSAKRNKDYDKKKRNFTLYVLGLGIGIPVIVVIALLSM